MSAPIEPKVDESERLLSALTPPCDVSNIRIVAGVLRGVDPCRNPARWILSFAFECGYRDQMAACDDHHDRLVAPKPPVFCNRCARIEPTTEMYAERI